MWNFVSLHNLFSECVLPSSNFCLVKWWLNLFKQPIALLVMFDANSYSCHWRSFLLLCLDWFDFQCWDDIIIIIQIIWVVDMTERIWFWLVVKIVKLKTFNDHMTPHLTPASPAELRLKSWAIKCACSRCMELFVWLALISVGGYWAIGKWAAGMKVAIRRISIYFRLPGI